MRHYLNDTKLANHCDQPIKTKSFSFPKSLGKHCPMHIYNSKFNFTWLKGCTSTNISHYIDANGDDLIQVFFNKKIQVASIGENSWKHLPIYWWNIFYKIAEIVKKNDETPPQNQKLCKKITKCFQKIPLIIAKKCK